LSARYRIPNIGRRSQRKNIRNKKMQKMKKMKKIPKTPSHRLVRMMKRRMVVGVLDPLRQRFRFRRPK
jgi:hypothetical protein